MYVIELRCMHNRLVNDVALSMYVIGLRCVPKNYIYNVWHYYNQPVNHINKNHVTVTQ